jgi:hypothetical protein
VSDDELRRLVAWPVAEPSAGRSAARVLGGLLQVASTVLTFGADAATGARRPSWDVPADPSAYLDLGPVQLRLPSGARPEPVEATRREVWSTSSERPPALLPVAAWRVVEAVPQGHSGRRDAEAPWALTVDDGRQTGTLTGAWLALAWIGTLAGWPEP